MVYTLDIILDSAQHVRFEYTLSLAEVQCGAGKVVPK